jgi:hypothetical protein
VGPQRSEDVARDRQDVQRLTQPGARRRFCSTRFAVGRYVGPIWCTVPFLACVLRRSPPNRDRLRHTTRNFLRKWASSLTRGHFPEGPASQILASKGCWSDHLAPRSARDAHPSFVFGHSLRCCTRCRSCPPLHRRSPKEVLESYVYQRIRGAFVGSTAVWQYRAATAACRAPPLKPYNICIMEQ